MLLTVHQLSCPVSEKSFAEWIHGSFWKHNKPQWLFLFLRSAMLSEEKALGKRLPALHSVLFYYTSSDVCLEHLYTRDPAILNQWGLFTRRVDLCILKLLLIVKWFTGSVFSHSLVSMCWAFGLHVSPSSSHLVLLAGDHEDLNCTCICMQFNC